MDRRDQLRRGLNDAWEAIRTACACVGRSEHDVRLIAVSKLKPTTDIRIAYELGQRDFGENYVQELQRKQAELNDLPDARWHLIGHLQRNKAKHVAESGACVHTLDDSRLAAELNKRERRRAHARGLHPSQPSGRTSEVGLFTCRPSLARANCQHANAAEAGRADGGTA